MSRDSYEMDATEAVRLAMIAIDTHPDNTVDWKANYLAGQLAGLGFSIVPDRIADQLFEQTAQEWHVDMSGYCQSMDVESAGDAIADAINESVLGIKITGSTTGRKILQRLNERHMYLFESIRGS